MAIEGFSPPPSPPPPPYYQLLERGSARLGRVKNLDKTNIVHFSLNVAKMMLEQEDD